jgi:uncharacterized paraquat-inducible protein A
MDSSTIMYLVAGGTGALALLTFVALILVPAVKSYSRLWERIAAGFLSLYVLASLLLLGGGAGLALWWYWDELPI